MSDLPLKNNIDQHLVIIGRNIAAFRQKVLKESVDDFSRRLISYGHTISSSMLTDIESGLGHHSFEIYLCIFDIMQVLESVTDNMHNNAAIYISNLEHPANIEEHIQKALNHPKSHG